MMTQLEQLDTMQEKLQTQFWRPKHLLLKQSLQPKRLSFSKKPAAKKEASEEAAEAEAPAEEKKPAAKKPAAKKEASEEAAASRSAC